MDTISTERAKQSAVLLTGSRFDDVTLWIRQRMQEDVTILESASDPVLIYRQQGRIDAWHEVLGLCQPAEPRQPKASSAKRF